MPYLIGYNVLNYVPKNIPKIGEHVINKVLDFMPLRYRAHVINEVLYFMPLRYVCILATRPRCAVGVHR